MNIPFLFSFLSLIPTGFAQHQSLKNLNETKSMEYAWLESDSSKTIDFYNKAQTEVESLLMLSKNFKKIETFLFSKYEANLPKITEIQIDDSRKILLSRKDDHSVVTDFIAGAANNIFSTESLTPRFAKVENITISPNKDFLVIQVQIDGNIDFSRHFVYNLKTKTITGNFNGLSYQSSPSWISDYEMVTMHPDYTPPNTSAMIINLTNMQIKIIRDHNVFKLKDWVAITSRKKNSGSITNTKTGEKLSINTHISFLNDVAETNEAFYYITHEHTDGTIFRLEKKNRASAIPFIMAKDGHWVSSLRVLESKFLLVNYSRDSLVTLALFDLISGKKVSELSLPDNYDLSAANYQAQSEVVELTVYNFLNQNFKLAWNILDPAQTDLSVLPQNFTISNLEFISKLEYFTSHDGERIPARITYLKSTTLNGSNPTYIETYGAFNYIGFYLFPWLNSMKLRFLRKGGILVGTGVRGGAERGYSWYLDGTAENKANSALDLVAISDGLVEKGYTQSEKIASTGISAGGDNVSAAAQLSPSSFGLVIPISGIHDHFGFLRMDLWGQQWLFDYLDPNIKSNFDLIKGRAPLEIKTSSGKHPEFLIVCGQADTRVSKVHSYKLKAVLDEGNKKNVSKASLYCPNNTGHWPNDSSMNGRQGIKTDALIWSRIFDYFDLDF